MTTEDNRVLSRMRARELTVNETEVVSGALFNTLVCTGAVAGAKSGTATGPGDGDGCSDSDTDFS
jgi:hypothetical protein